MSDVQLMIAELKAGSEAALRNVPDEEQEKVLVNVKAADVLRLIGALEAGKAPATT